MGIKYWLYTWDPPEDGFEEWAIYTVDDIFEDEGVDMARVKEIIIDDWDYLKPTDTGSVFDDAITEDSHRVIKFLFDQVFY